MSHRFFQLQTEAAHGSRSSSPHRSSSHKSHSHSHSSHSHSSHRPQPQVTANYQNRSSSESSDSSNSSSSSYGSSYYYDPSQQSPNYTYDAHSQQRYSMDSAAPRVEVMRCSRCAKCVETIVNSGSRGAGDEMRRVSSEDASASGMVRFGHNLYYCDRCARMVGYK